MESPSPAAPPARQGDLLWEPAPGSLGHTNLARFQDFVARGRDLPFDSYPTLWDWSVGDVEGFWTTVAGFFDVRFHHPPERILGDAQMPGAQWFPGATLNYAEHALRSPEGDAILFATEPDPATGRPWRQETLTRAELAWQVAATAGALRAMGVGPGDRVAGFLPNIPETLVAFLAAASVGAIWSGCPAELSARGVVERFGQITPKVLFAVDGYRYGGKAHDRLPVLGEILTQLPSVEHLVLVPYLDADAEPPTAGRVRTTRCADLQREHADAALEFTPVGFDHPLWILFSSGTTGAPKPIVHGHGGMVLEHLKALSLHLDLRAGDRFFWFTTAGWMMWNFLVSGLLLPGVTVVLYDGSPKFPDLGALWRFAAENGVTYFGTSAPYLTACQKEGLSPGETCDLSRLRAIGSTGAPLPPEGFRWVYDHVKRDLLLGSASGGTDVCTAFVLSCPHLPVRAGELQCRGLGAKIEAWGEDGKPVPSGEVGELVLTAPFPAMPVALWGDEDGSRMRASYFDKYPGVWRHGDWIAIHHDTGACVIYGRSDSTLNRGGVRMGTSEFYRVVEDLPEVAEALVVDTGGLGQKADKLLLFIVLRDGATLDDALHGRIAARLRADLSPRHVPDAIHAVPEIPHTLNGKKMEVPVKRILAGTPPEKAASREAMSNPDALEPFVALAKTLG